MAGGRVPTTIADFDKYINKTATRLLAIEPVSTNPYWQVFGLTSQNSLDWDKKRKDWNTLYLIYGDELQSTSAIKKAVKTAIKDFTTFAEPLLNIIAASPNSSGDDELTFNFVKVRKKPTVHKDQITEECFARVKKLSGGDFKIACRSDHDTKRASRAAKATGVQVAYKILSSAPTDNQLESFDADASDFTKEVFSGATFILKAKVANVGKWIVAFFRWYDSKHPLLAGSWSSDVYVTVIA